jgi:XTP/dITP diphosphohydrolase
METTPSHAFEKLLRIMNELRERCPWDQKQTMETLRPLTIEECYELSDALIQMNPNEIKNELGDLFLHLVFYTKIAEEKNWFNVSDVLHTLCEKLIHRHPHIYGNLTVKNEEEVKRNWEQLKLKEGRSGVLEGVPTGLPSLVKAWRIQEKAAGIGFDWKEPSGSFDKIKEEWDELASAIQTATPEEQELELGDVLFSIVNYARHLGINPDSALEKSNRKFIARFQLMEKMCTHQNMNDLNEKEWDLLWESAKKSIKTQ